MTKVIYEDGEPILRSDWWLGDVMSQADELQINITREEAIKVMELVARTHDSCVGINWDVINNAILIIKEEANDTDDN